MRIAIRETREDGSVGAVTVIHLIEAEGVTIETEEVDDGDEHWANQFPVWRYTPAQFKDTLVQDKGRRTAEWVRKHRVEDSEDGLPDLVDA